MEKLKSQSTHSSSSHSGTDTEDRSRLHETPFEVRNAIMETRKFLHWCISIASVLATFAVAATASAQGATLTGKVTSEQGREIAGANVIIPDLNISVGTNAAGNYTIVIPAARLSGGTVAIRIRAIGYVPRGSTIALNAGQQTA